MSNHNHHICAHVCALNPYVPGEQPRVQGLIKLNTNENPYPPSPTVDVALAAFAAKTLRLYPDPASTALRACVAGLHATTPEQVFFGNGSDEVLALCTRAFVENDGVIGCFDPSYSLYPTLAAIRPARLAPVPLKPDFSWNMPAGYQADLFYLANPNAPTGVAFPKETIRAFCATFKGVVLIDEAYVDFAPEHCLELALTLPNVLVSRTLSKSYSLAGARAGYAIGPAPLIAAINKIKDSYNVNALTQTVALAALQDQDHMKANTAKIIATRERTAEALRTRGYHVYPSATNFLWLQPPAGNDAASLFTWLRERNILARFFPGEKTGACLRVTIGTDTDMDAFLAALP